MRCIKLKHQFYSVLVVFCILHAFEKFGVTSDSSPSLSVGLGLDIARSQDRPKTVGLGDSTIGFPNHSTPRATPELVSDDLEVRHRPSRSDQNWRASSEATDNIQNRSSELNDLFLVGTGRHKPEYNASIPLSSKAKLVVLEGGSTVKTDQIRTSVPGVINVGLNGRPRPRPALSTGVDLLPTNSNTSSAVPSEGRVLLEGLSHISTKSALEVKLPTIDASEIDVKDGKDTKVDLGLDLSQGLPTRDEVSSVVNKQIEPQDSHISARKGADLSEQTEPTNGTLVPLTFRPTISDIELYPNLHTQKITPRKGAELPKIFPRKGVDEQFMNPNSDQFSSDLNNNTRTTISVSRPTSTTTYSSRPAGNSTDIVKHINTSKAGTLSLQNGSTIAENTSTQSVNSESPITARPTSSRPSSAMEDIASKTEPTSDVAVTNSNLILNVTMHMPSHNITLGKLVVDKSGIIASYPPLKKRPKPLKTTDLNSVNISPITTEHSSSEHDYVIPIVVTILTVPMLVVLVLFLYKKGSEFWERRHYRRMDFLIDGMYND